MHFIRFLKQIVLERISFQTRGLGTWASAPSTSKMDCWGPGSGQSSRLSKLSEGRAVAEKMEMLWEVWGKRQGPSGHTCGAGRTVQVEMEAGLHRGVLYSPHSLGSPSPSGSRFYFYEIREFGQFPKAL